MRDAHAEVRHAYSWYYPSISFEGSKGSLRAFGEQRGYPGLYGKTDTYDARIGLRWTVFDGLLREPREDCEGRRGSDEEVRNRQTKLLIRFGLIMQMRKQPCANRRRRRPC